MVMNEKTPTQLYINQKEAIVMILREFIKNLVELAEKDPRILDLKVVYNYDDEGNGYQEIHYGPSEGHHDGERGGDFTSAERIEEHIQGLKEEGFEEETLEINAICIN